MPFYTLMQEQTPGEDGRSFWKDERFVCFEADSHVDAINRATWFGIDVNETLNYTWGPYRRWLWHSTSQGRAQPEIARVAFENCHRQGIEGDWIVVYKNGNLRSNRGGLVP